MKSKLLFSFELSTDKLKALNSGLLKLLQSEMSHCSALKYAETLKGKYFTHAGIAALELLHFLLKQIVLFSHMYHRISVKNRLCTMHPTIHWT